MKNTPAFGDILFGKIDSVVDGTKVIFINVIIKYKV